VKLAHALYTEGNYDAALAEVETALRDNPESAEGQLIRGLTLARQGNFRAAIAPLRMAIEFGDDPWIASFTLATMYLRLEDFSRALNVADDLLRLDAEDPQALALRGEILSRMGRSDEAIAALRAATKFNPNLPSARLRLGELYSERQDWSSACLELSAAVELAPTDPRAMQRLAVALRGLGQSGEAVQVCRRAMHCAAPKVELFLTLAECCLDERLLFDAISAARVAMMLDPKDPAAHRMMSRIFAEQGHAAEARRHQIAAERLAEAAP
jgi:tetratricopeptide (TPR) repeat protein